jgi:uncharacterized cupredoxin-like copper-binding protein
MKKFTSILLLTLFSGALLAHADHGDDKNKVGVPGTSQNVTRTIEVTMDDTMRFTPSVIDVEEGETVRLMVKNTGQLKHVMVIDEMSTLMEHAKMMQEMPDMMHYDLNTVSLEPNETGEIIWTFTRSGKVDFACLMPGHYEAGMHGIFNVK